MATIRKFCCNDLLRFASINLDHLAITAEMQHYLRWLINWSDYCMVAVAPGNRFTGYFLGGFEEIEEGKAEQWQGLTAFVNVASEYRRQKLATKFMQLFEKQLVEKMFSSQSDREYFACLFVGVNNTPAINMFQELGYDCIQTLDNFYPHKEDAYEMSKALDGEKFWFYD